MAHDIFISYASSERNLAMEIYNFYQKNNYKCWMVPNDLSGEGNYAMEVMNAITDSSMVLFIASEKSNNSLQCHDEIQAAFENNIQILVYPIDDSIFDSSMQFYMKNQYYLKNQHYLGFDVESPLEELLKQAASIIGERSTESDGLSDGVSKLPGKASKSEIREAGISSVYLSYSAEDESEIEPFRNLGYEIAEGIGEDTVLASFISKNSKKSCLDDIEKAFSGDVPVVLVHLDGEDVKFPLKFKIKYRSKIKALSSVDKSDADGYVELLDGFGLKRDAVSSFESVSQDLSDAEGFSYLAGLVESSLNVALDSDIAFDGEVSQNGIEITSDGTVIDGDGHTIDARGKSRMFDVRAKGVVFKNIRFVNGLGSAGGVVNASDSTVTFEECIFENNVADSNGGAIFQYGGKVRVVGCSFTNNRSNNMGGALQVESGILKIDDSIIESSTSRYGGAIRSNDSELIVTGSSICGCSSDYGGAINFNNGEITISNCCFKENTAVANGGAIETQNGVLNVDDTRFFKNRAKYGSAVRNHSQTVLKKCRFIDESSEEGVIFNKKGTLDMVKCEFTGNDCERYIIYNEDYLNLNDAKFISNDAGNVISNLGNCGLSYCTFSQNICDYGLSNEKSSFLFKCDFSNEEILNESRMTLEGVTGNALFITNNGTAFIKNRKEGLESHILNNGKIEYMTRSDDSFDFTYLDELISGSDSKIITLTHDIVCAGYERDFYEGGIVLDVDGLVIDANNHAIDGGGISRIFTVTGRNVRLVNMTLKNGFSAKNDYHNPMNNNGGAIRINSKGSLECVNCRFIENVSHDKGGAIDNRGGTLSLSDCEFLRNSSQFLGGAIINRKGGKVTLNDSTLVENSSNHGGGAIENVGEMVLEKCSLSSNSSKEGGAIKNRQDAVISSCSFMANEADGGGAIYNGRNATASVMESLFCENHAGNGGAIENRGLQLLVGSSEFDANSSDDDGGAIYSFYCDMFLVENTVMRRNSSGGSGGGIWNYTPNSQLEISNCDLNGNSPDNVFND